MTEKLPEYQIDNCTPLKVFDSYQGNGAAHIVESQRERCKLREILGSGLQYFKVRAVLTPSDDRLGVITVRRSTDGYAWFELTGRDIPESISSVKYTTVRSAIAVAEEWLYRHSQQ